MSEPFQESDHEWTKEQNAAFNKLTDKDWTVEDWKDLHYAMEEVRNRVAKRHGIIP